MSASLPRPMLTPEALAAVPLEVNGAFCPGCHALAGYGCIPTTPEPRFTLSDGTEVHGSRIVRALAEAIAERMQIPPRRILTGAPGEHDGAYDALRSIARWRDDDGRELDSATAIAIAEDGLSW